VPATNYTRKLGIAGKKGRVINVWRNGKFVVHTDKGNFPIYEIPENVKGLIHDIIGSKRKTRKKD
jgi:hypothetical protein